MATTVTLAPEADASARADGLGAGQGNHLPAGTWSGVHYRAGLRFALPAGWSGATKITSATLSVYTTDFQHVGPVNSAIYVRRQNISGLWLKAEGSQSCESGFSAGNTTQYTDLAATTADQVSFSSGTSATTKRSATVTAAVEYYRANGASKLVFVLDGSTSSDVSEFWSTEHGSASDASLSITYETQTAPNAPTGLTPANNAVVDSQSPLLSWVHNDPQSDPQAGADIEWNNPFDPTTPLPILHPVNPTDQFLTVAGPLPRGLGTFYTWRARTYDASGAGTWSPTQQFSVRPLPVVTISPTRVMAFDAANHQPRLVVSWTADQAQTSYRVQTASGYDSGVIPGSVQTFTIPRNLVNGTAETVTVTVASGTLSGSASQAFTPRWGLTTMHRDLGAAPVQWGATTLAATVVPPQALPIEYGSDPTSSTVPGSGWLSTLGAVPLARHLFWRAWFIPSATASPVLDSVTIQTSTALPLVDYWSTTRDGSGIVAPWVIDGGEAVYGTRSMRCDVSGAGPFIAYSAPIKVRVNRNYILTGLMKSQGNSGAQFALIKADGTTPVGGGMSLPAGPVQSPALVATVDWYNPASSVRDTIRYRTPVWVSDADQTVYIVLRAGGTAGAQAWFDAVKLEESTVATPWSPGAVGAVIVDAGGVQVDANKGGVFRIKGTDGAARSVVESGAQSLKFGGDTELASPSPGVLAIAGAAIRTGAFTAPVVNVYTATGAAIWTKPAGLAYVVVECVGAGGGGGPGTVANSIGGGGGGGAYARRVFPVAALAGVAVGGTFAIAVGTHGAGGGAGAGGTGGASTFSGTGITTVSGGGGTGGGANGTAGAGGAGSGGDVNVSGGVGGRGGGDSTSAAGQGGNAGGGFGNGGSHGVPGSTGTTVTGFGFGGGGGGGHEAASTSRVGGDAADGLVIVTEIYL